MVLVSCLCIVLMLNACFGDVTLRTIPLQANELQRLNLLPDSTTLFTLSNITSDVSYVVFHIHSQYKNVTVSLNGDWDVDSSTSPGSDRGDLAVPFDTYLLQTTVNQASLRLFKNTTLVNQVTCVHISVEFYEQENCVVTVLWPYQTFASWFVNSSNSENVSVIAMATTYKGNEPIPGGCNQEFNMENNPNIHLTFDAHSTLLQFQFSNIGFPRKDHNHPLDCESKASTKNLTYDLYLYYMRENDLSEEMFFEGLGKMLKADSAVRYGTKITGSFQRDKHHSNFTIASNLAKGAVYGVVITEMGADFTTKSMYIPAVTYACNFEGKVDNCEAKHNITSWVLCTFAGVVGLFLCFLGHRFFKTEMFVFGFSSFLLIFFIVFSLGTDFSFTARLLIAAGFGILGGCLWLTFWWFVGVGVLSVLLVGLNLGYLFSSILFFTPFGNIDLWKSDFNYGMIFASGVLVVPVFLLYFTRVLNILSCSVIGSYCFAVAINSYIHGTLSYIIINSVKRSVFEEFNQSIMIAPFQISEIILCVVWGCLAIFGTAFQLHREKGRPEFPICPYQVRKRDKLSYTQAVNVNNCNERAPLLVDANQAVGRRMTYGTDNDAKVM